MYANQMSERQQFNYPPFFRLIKITVKHKDLNVLNLASNLFARNIRNIFKERVLGPEFPAVSRIQNWYLKNILIKLEKEKSQLSAKSILQNEANLVLGMDEFKSLKIIFDVDPF
jgi:primosomal protein N' (replication factor Y)